ncbi:MAG: 2-C-methyl-D-erythritol 2,4-cyclodiphosphate synthase [Proteobacteria bacterium]|nr:2-C-methyl-D-erythritol 2,4-cyclodiphosphate synthase [Pseudomonadota bacterium]
MDIRIGNGIDIHQFAKGRKLFLGGVHIPSDIGLKGHSDADVLLHAVTDAVLGALAWGDIGQWFPDTDEKYKDIDSKILFLEVWRKARKEGWKLVNCDCTLLAQIPKLQPIMQDITKSLAHLFEAELTQINVKATTTERLGFVGREEGILAQATLLITK